MKLKEFFLCRFTSVGVAALLLHSVPAMATTTATGTNTLATTMNFSVNVQTAVAITISTGTVAPGTPCTVNSGGGGDFSISMGNVNGLGVGSPSCGGVVSTSSSAAVYATNYQITPSYSGFTSTTATVSLTAPAFTHNSVLTLLEGSSTGALTTVPTSGATHAIAVSTSGTAISRFVGVQVSNMNGTNAFPGTAGASGADSTLVTFTMTVP